MKSTLHPLTAISFAVAAMTLVACSDQSTSPAASNSLATNEVAANTDVALYQAAPLASWNVVIEGNGQELTLEGESAALPENKMTIQRTDKDGTQDALSIQWDGVWGGGVSLKNGAPLDLSDYQQTGALVFDLNVIELAKGGINVRFFCGENCERAVPFTEKGFSMAGQGWQSVRIPLSCFMRDGDDFSGVTQPFKLELNGQGEIGLANILVQQDVQGNVDCPDYKTVSITPAMLSEFWARDWWEPRHKEKLAQAQGGNIDLIMLGDSITHGWENAGKETWDQYYAERNAYNIGFSGDRTENVLWRLQHGEVDGLNPKAVVLMIGTNNTGHRLEKPEFIATGIKTILDELRTRLPEAKILLLAIFPRDEKPDAEMRKNNEAVNNILATFADNEHIHFLDINRVFLDDNGNLPRDIMPDLLHPNEKGYALWAEAMEPKLKELLGE